MDELADLLLGACCPGCGAPGLTLCPSCRELLDRDPWWADDLGGFPDLEGWVAAAGDYREPLRSVLSAHKDRGAWGLSGVLSTQLARAVRLVLDDGPQAPGFVGGEGPICLVPVPSSPRQVRARGYDHAMALARRAARNLGQGPHSVRVRARAVLRRVGSVADQSTLGRGARIRNQAGSMRARTAPRGASAVVVDDICTTGSSLAEAFRALDEAGWRVLGGAVVAHPSRGGQQCGKPPCEIVQVPLDCL